MFGISFSELVIIFLLILIVMGPEKLPEVARWAGKGLRELRQASNTLRNALTLEDFDDRSRRSAQRSAPRVGSQKTDSAPTSPAAKKKPPPPDIDGDHPAYAKTDAGAPPTHIDQVDDAEFEAMLERQYRLRHSDLHTVELSSAQVSDALKTIEIPARLATDDTITIELMAAEAA